VDKTVDEMRLTHLHKNTEKFKIISSWKAQVITHEGPHINNRLIASRLETIMKPRHCDKNSVAPKV